MFVRGLRTGLVLQLAIGPVWVWIFQFGALHGVTVALPAAAGITLGDALFVVLGMCGVGGLLAGHRRRAIARWCGVIILCLFAVTLLLAPWTGPLLPGLGLERHSGGGPFEFGFLLTISSPLTILFWTGVFAAESARLRTEQTPLLRLWPYALGALLPTAPAMVLTAAFGAFCASLLPSASLPWFSAVAGLLIVALAIRMFQRAGCRRHNG